MTSDLKNKLRINIDGWLSSLVFSFIIFLISFPMLAKSPQSGDGAEQVMVALNGGLLHPPGFPLQTWLNRLFVLLPFDSPSTALSLLNLLAHAATVFLILESLRLLKLGLFARLASASAYSFFPPIWYLAVQPEVFSVSYFFIALIIFLSLYLWQRHEKINQTVFSLFLGGVCGLASAQHPIIIVIAPAAITAAYFLLKNRKTLALNLFLLVLAFLICGPGLYLSLLIRIAHSVWPGWGGIYSIKDVIGHALRSEYGILSLSAIEGTRTFNGLAVFAENVLRYWHVLMIFLIPGLYYLFKNERSRMMKFSILGSLICGVLFLFISHLPGQENDAKAVLERFSGTALIPLIVILAYGINSFFSKNVSRWVYGIAIVMISVLLIHLFVRAKPISDASVNNTADVFSEALGLSLPEGVIYIGVFDIEASYGARKADKIIFPVHAGLLNREWYRNEVIPSVEPRIGRGILNIEMILEKAQRDNIPVAATHREIFDKSGNQSELRGMYYVHQRSFYSELTINSVNEAVKLCPLVSKLNPLPAKGFVFGKAMRFILARAYDGASQYLKAVNKPDLSRIAKQIQIGINESQSREALKKVCSEFRAALTSY